MKEKIVNTIENLKKNGFQATYYNSVLEVKEEILKSINEDEDIGIGGSMTLFEMGIHKSLKEKGNNVYWHWLVDVEKRDEERNKASQAKVYLSSSNAVTEEGKLVNIDGIGNRVASMVYGHERVYIIVGINKICSDTTSAIKRIKEITCPKNAKRLGLNTPCNHTGLCNDCQSQDRMCNITVILDHMPMQGNIHVLVVNETLGY